MKKASLLVIVVLFAISGLKAQMPTASSVFKRTQFGYSLNNDFWLNVPDSVNTRLINQGVDVFFRYNFPMNKKGTVAFFAGGALSMHNFYTKSFLNYNDSTAFFSNPTEKGIKSGKLALAYFDIPFGFNFKTNNKMHASVGFSVGWKVNAHTKYKGSDLGLYPNNKKIKNLNLDNIETLRYGPFVVLGYDWIGIKAQYQLASIFKDNKGPKMSHFTVGIVLKQF